MHDDEFRDEMRGYLHRREARVRPIHVALPRGTQRSMVRMVGLALVVASGWRRLNTPHSAAPNGPSGIGLQGPIAYDAATGRVVMVTNETGPHFQACSSQTWTFDGTDWRLEHPATPLPAPLAALVNEQQTGHVIAVLPSRDAVRNVGKLSTSCPAGSPQARALPQSSTWRWTGSNWIEVTTGTEPDRGSLAVASNGTFVGLDAVSGTSMVATDDNEALWSWNGARWTALPGSGEGPPPRTDSMLSIDTRGHVVLFGGINQRADANDFDTWLWNASRWQKVTGPAPQTATPSPVSFTAPAG